MNIVIVGGCLVTCDPEDRVLSGSLVIRGRRIASLGESASRAEQDGPYRVIDARGCAVIPGFVQAHVHLAQTLMRGMADDLALLDWLKRRIWPLEAAHDEASLAASAELGLLELMRAGTTSILDMGTVHAHDVVMDACLRSGIRALSGKALMDVAGQAPARLVESTRDALAESDRLCREWNGKADGRIGYAYAPRFVLSCSEQMVRGAVERAADVSALVHTHAAEHAEERAAVRAAFGEDDIEVLRRWGVRGPRAIVAHGVMLTDAQAAALAADGTRVVHCPSANLKLASGIAPVAKLQALGVVVALGADGAPCNNNLDPWIELRHATLLSSVRGGIGALTAVRALRLATIDGARALGFAEQTGSLEVGKRADVAVVRVDGAHVEPGGDVFSRLVYACQARDVESVIVDGQLVVHRGEHKGLDAERVIATARHQAARLRARADL